MRKHAYGIVTYAVNGRDLFRVRTDDLGSKQLFSTRIQRLETRSDGLLVDLSARNVDDQVVQGRVRDFRRDAVSSKKHERGDQTDALVAVDEGMVLTKAVRDGRICQGNA
jgi:hypothetical protein